MSDSVSLLGGGDRHGVVPGAVWRPPPGKRGAFLLARLGASGGRKVRVRRLGETRAGEIRLTRFLRNAAVTCGEMLAEAAARTAERCVGRHVLAIQDTTVLRSSGGGGDYLHAVLALEARDGAILGLIDGRFLQRDGSRRADRRAAQIEEKESFRWLEGADQAASVCAGAVAARDGPLATGSSRSARSSRFSATVQIQGSAAAYGESAGISRKARPVLPHRPAAGCAGGP